MTNLGNSIFNLNKELKMKNMIDIFKKYNYCIEINKYKIFSDTNYKKN